MLATVCPGAHTPFRFDSMTKIGVRMSTKSTVRRGLAVGAASTIAVIAVAFLGACGSASSDSHGHMADGSASAPMMSADAMFAAMMIPHHEQAVVMSDLAPTRARSAEIKALAVEIKGAQAPEIEQMRTWLREWGIPEMGMGDMGAHAGHGGMQGMLTQEQLDELAAASGADFDRLFATYMIEHHEGAVDMAEDVLRSGTDPRVAALAMEIIESQTAEIAEMRAFLKG